LVFNITHMMPENDPYKTFFLSLETSVTPYWFMTVVDILCKGLDGLMYATTSGNDVLNTFYRIVGTPDREMLLNFNNLMVSFLEKEPGTSDDMVKKCFTLRNYFLLRDEIQSTYEESYVPYNIEDRLPDHLLSTLGIIDCFFNTGL
jgi:hypothetical protein